MNKTGSNLTGKELMVETDRVSSEAFLLIIKKYKHFRVKVETENKEPFRYLYFRVAKSELQDIVRMNKMEVSYEIRFNSQVDNTMEDMVYVMAMRMTNF